jgi:hypothetical protein
MASTTGRYIDIEITKLPAELDGTLMYDQCTTSNAGSYIGIEITKLSAELANTLV